MPRKTPDKPAATSLPKLAGATEIARKAGVSNASVVTNWRRRFDDFPEPIQVLAMGPVYLDGDADEFLRRHPELTAARRIADEVKDQIRKRVSDGELNVSLLAREFGVSRSTVYETASDLLFDQDGTEQD